MASRPVSHGFQGEKHPATSLILLLALAFAGAVIMGTLSAFIGFITLNRAGSLTGLEDLASATTHTGFLKILQAGFSIGMFILPPLLMEVFDKPRQRYLAFTTSVNPLLWPMVLGIMFFAGPLFEQAILLNERLQLPEALSGLENWMKAKEAEQERLTKLLLSDTSYWGMATSLIVVAVIAAIGEEFFFRGCLQRLLSRWFNNPHTGIWVTAVIFSAIHLQFYGFLPRMLMGALFGYLLLWGKNIWLPVLAHFINNATVALSAFFLLRQGRSLEEMDAGLQIPAYFYFISFVLTAVLLYQYHKTATAQNIRYNGETLD